MKKSSKIILSALASAGVLAAAATAWAYPAWRSASGGVPLPCRRPDARTGPGDASGGSG